MGTVEHEPFVLFANDKFFGELKKKHGVGMLGRKPLQKMISDKGIKFEDLDRDEAKEVLEKMSVKATASTSDVMKSLALALFTPTSLFYALSKKVVFVEGMMVGDDLIIIHLLAEIPRLFKTTLLYHIFLTVPINESGWKLAVDLYRGLRSESREAPITEEDWENLRPIREKNAEALKVKGFLENSWDIIGKAA
ncbi:MAG: hypothetical protein ACP5TH_01690 [Fervidicoccaceae archaeon]